MGRFNPLRFGAGALPRLFLCNARGPDDGFNPLRFGAGALPLHWFGDGFGDALFQSPSFRGGSTPQCRNLGQIEDFEFQSPSFRGGSTPPVLK